MKEENVKDLGRYIWKNWGFSLILGIGYLALFHLWNFLSPGWVQFTGFLGGMGLAGYGVRSWSQGYFLDKLDLWAHGMVVLDLVLEGFLIPEHSGYGFYVCALGFGLVCGGYRWVRSESIFTKMKYSETALK